MNSAVPPRPSPSPCSNPFRFLALKHYFTVTVRFVGAVGVTCTDAATAGVEKTELPLTSNPDVRA